MSKKTSLVRNFSLLLIISLFFFPNLVRALTLGEIFTNLTKTLLVPIGGFLITGTFVVFLWGLVKYMYSLGEKEKVEGRWLMVWGVVALFVMGSVWGLVWALNDTLGITPAMNAAPQGGIVIP